MDFWENVLQGVLSSVATATVLGALAKFLIDHRFAVALESAKAELVLTSQLRKTVAERRIKAFLDLVDWLDRHWDPRLESPHEKEYEDTLLELRLFLRRTDYEKLRELLRPIEKEEPGVSVDSLYDFIRDQLIGAPL